MSAEPLSPVAIPWLGRLWPTEDDTSARPMILARALAIGAVAALIIRPQAAGSGCLVIGLGLLLMALSGRVGHLTNSQRGAAGLAIALLGVTAFRSASWLVALCLVAAWIIGTLALVGGRTWTGLILGSVTTCLASARTVRWVARTPASSRFPVLRSRRAWLVLAVTSGLVTIFGALFATADPAYAALLDDALPSLNAPDAVWRLSVLAFVAATALVASFLAQHPPAGDALAPPPGKPVRRSEWVVPLAVLDLLFLSFVLVQLTVLFGGRAHVLTTHGLSYAQYARQGFWQLLVVTGLTLAVVALAVRTAPRTSPTDLLLVRLLLAVLCLLALVVVVSALHRMSLYEREYGFTRLRVFVDAVELGLGGTFVLLLAAGVRMTSSWLPRSVLALAALGLLVLAAVNPDAYIADRNVSRFEQTRRIDLTYLATLSADAVPPLMRLPAPLRGCALERVAAELRDSTDPWYDVNLSRVRARQLLEAQGALTCRSVLLDR